MAPQILRDPKAPPFGYVPPEGLKPTPPQAPAAAAVEPLPPWLVRNAPLDPTLSVPLSPSSAYDEKVMVRTAKGADRRKALARGAAMHRLLQSLPDIPPAARAEAARRHLGGIKEFDADECESMLGQVLALFDDPRFTEPRSRSSAVSPGRPCRRLRSPAR